MGEAPFDDAIELWRLASYHVAMMKFEDIRGLSVADRIRLVEEIWDTIPASPDDAPVTENQKTALDLRLDRYRRDPQGRPWSDLLNGLDARG